MNRILPLSLTFLALILVLTACGPQRAAAPAQNANMANPASVYCTQHGGKLVIREGPDGQAGVCAFPDGSFCDEWAYFRGECKPGQPTPTVLAAISTLEPAANGEDWKVYKNEQLSYTFQYPPDALPVTNDDPLKTLSIRGSTGWPAFTISHPADRPEYRPPEGTDLFQWLSDHNLLGDDRQPDTQIAGTTAIHLRHARSPQSFAYDRYYFARAGQLYQITIGHVDDKEDWQVYNRFLESFQFIRAQ